MIIPVGQAEQEHALAESRKHAAAAQAHAEAELAAVHAKLAAAAEQLEQQRRSHAASLEAERQAAKSKESSIEVICAPTLHAHVAQPHSKEQALCRPPVPTQQHVTLRVLLLVLDAGSRIGHQQIS